MDMVNGPSIIDRTEVGGIARTRDKLGLPGAYVAPSGPVETRLAEIWAATFNLDRVGVDDDFFELGGDSLRGIELFLVVEKEFGQTLPVSLLFESGTIAQIAERIGSKTSLKCVVPMQSGGTNPPFFCVHDLSGHIIHYRPLARRLGEDETIYGIQSLSLDRNEAPLVRMDDISKFYLDEIKTIQPHGPYYLGGYSFGGRVAFRMAQMLRDAGEEVALLALIDAWSQVGRQRIRLHQWLALKLKRAAGSNLAELGSSVAFWIKRAFQEFTYFPLRARFFAATCVLCEWSGRPVPRFLRNPQLVNLYISAKYHAEPYQGNGVLLEAERTDWAHADRHEGWHQLVQGGLEVRNVPGEHVEILEEPYVATLAKELKICLEEARSKSSAPAANRKAPPK